MIESFWSVILCHCGSFGTVSLYKVPELVSSLDIQISRYTDVWALDFVSAPSFTYAVNGAHQQIN